MKGVGADSGYPEAGLTVNLLCFLGDGRGAEDVDREVRQHGPAGAERGDGRGNPVRTVFRLLGVGHFTFLTRDRAIRPSFPDTCTCLPRTAC